MTKKRIMTLISWSILAICLWIGWKLFVNNLQEVRQLNVDFGQAYLLILSCIYTYFCRGMLQQALVLPCGASLSWWEQLGITTVTTVGNLVLPASAGVAYKVMYLKKVFHIDWLITVLYLAVSWIFITIADSTIAIISLFYLNFLSSPLTVIFFTINIICIGVLFLPSDFKLVRNITLLHQINLGWMNLKKKPSYMVRILIVSFFLSLGNSMIVLASCRLINIPIDIFSAIILGSVRSISTYIILTPGSLGITEIFLASSAKLLGVGAVEGVIISGIFRLGMLSVGLILAPIMYLFMNKKMHKLAG